MSCLMYRTGQALGGGGGGGSQDGLPFIVADLAALQAITADDGAIGATTDNGWQYVRASGVWALYRAEVDEQANLPSGDILDTAICLVGTGAGKASTAFYSNGLAWFRMPDGVAYGLVVATSGDLPGVGAAGDRATTTDTGFVWEYDGAVWEIVYGLVDTFASLPSVDVAGSALMGVGSDGVHERTWYGRHAGNWVRTPEAVPYGRTLSSLQDVLTTDLDGDYGLWNGFAYRLKRGIALAPSGTADLWLPPVVYAGAITMRAHLLGTESNTGLSTTLTNQGWTVATSGAGGSINTTAAPGFVRITDSNTASSSASLGVTAWGSAGASPMSTSKKWYLQAGMRCPLATAAAYLTACRDGTNIWNLYQSSGVALTIGADAANPPTSIAAGYVRDGRTALPTSGAASVVEVVDEGASVYTMVRRDGRPYAGTRRSLVTSAAAAGFFIGDISGATTGVTVDLQFCYALEWT